MSERLLKLETSVTPATAVRALRQLATSAGWKCHRISGSRLVDRWAIIMPIAQATRSLGLVIDDGPLAPLAVQAHSHVQGSAGSICIVEWLIPDSIEGDDWRLLLKHWVTRHPRCPWRWTFRERSLIGFLLPVFRRSRRTFSDEGIATERGAWPPSDAPVWPPRNWDLSSDAEE